MEIFYVVFSLLLAAVMSENSPDCPKIYQRFSASHTYCQPKNASCHRLRSNVSQKEIHQVIELHNHYRSIIATQQNGNEGLPPAANMLFMEWDNELAAVAQRRADQCIYAHDKGNQRRVRNFGVGQNIGQQKITGVKVEPPQPDWPSAIAGFFAEIKNFRSNEICGSREQPGPGEIGHFTQLVWAKTFRVGCGYTMYKDGNTYFRLYYCNYGPAGNDNNACVYKEGRACSKCPVNTQCSIGSQNPGLCKRINNDPPYTPITVPTIFNCNFINPNSPDCNVYQSGDGSWYITPALGGNYLETVLNPGQNGTIVFSKRIVGSANSKTLCVQVRYRKGPDLAKDKENNVAKAIYVIPSLNDFTAVFNLRGQARDIRQNFIPFSMTLQWKDSTQLKLSFAVPNGATPQFFDVASIVAFNDKCPHVEY